MTCGVTLEGGGPVARLTQILKVWEWLRARDSRAAVGAGNCSCRGKADSLGIGDESGEGRSGGRGTVLRARKSLALTPGVLMSAIDTDLEGVRFAGNCGHWSRRPRHRLVPSSKSVGSIWYLYPDYHFNTLGAFGHVAWFREEVCIYFATVFRSSNLDPATLEITDLGLSADAEAAG
ncbi:hypothetical protein B0H14DRAFT_2578618 [Mycena olivaceomarginata]|nr:hypothetical protein B0H14DRAFT_2578618 [Mycena olivaceomarginata]